MNDRDKSDVEKLLMNYPALDEIPDAIAETAEMIESTKQTQIARNAPCTCGSGAKFKRCCGVDAPPVLSTPQVA